MAQKQYSFDFVLNAMLNGGFSSTFSKAQQEFVRLGNEIKNLQAIQRDIASYQKQASAVEHTTQKLENLGKQHDLIQKEIKETEGSTTALERKELELEQKISNTSAALEKQQARLDSTRERLDAAGVSTADLTTKDAELTAKIQELTAEQKEAAEGAEEFKDAGAGAFEVVARAIAAAGVAEALGRIGDAYLGCVETAGDFGQAMSAVEAIAGATGEEMAALTQQAKELGATTKFTAQQSANAMEYMAMAGWDASEMLAGMSGMTTLAAAAGEDLAQVSDIVTDNLSAFGLQASDTARFADVLAAAAANSNTNISVMGETFKNSSSVAGALGYRIEDVAVMVGLMANNAVKGSRAGTALRNIFNGLLGGVTLTAEAFGELEYSAVDSNGSMKGLMETVEDLRGYFDQMTEAEKVNNAATIAGMRGYNGLLAILNATDEEFQSLYASVTDCAGAAERMAKVKLDGLNGDITIMNSAMEALQTTIGEQFEPELRGLAQAGTEALGWVNDFIKEDPALVKGIMAAAGALGAGVAALTGLAAVTKVLIPLMGALTAATPGVNAILGVTAAAAGAVGVATALNTALDYGVPKVKELTEAARGMGDRMEDASLSYERAEISTLAAANVAERYIDRLEEMGDRAELSGEEQERYHQTLVMLAQVMPELAGRIDLENDAIQGGTAALRANTAEWKRNAMAQALQEKMTAVYQSYADVLLEAEGNAMGLASAQEKMAVAQQKIYEIQARMKELEDEASAEDDAETVRRRNAEYQALEGALTETSNEYEAARLSANNYALAMEEGAGAAEEARAAVERNEQAVQRLTGGTEGYADGQEAATAASRRAQSVLRDTMEKVQELAEAYQETYEAALKSFEGQFGLFDEAKKDADATVEAAQTAQESQLAYWKEYAGNIAALKERSADDLGLTQGNYEALMELVRSGTPEAAALAAEFVEAIDSGDTQALTKLGETVGEVKELQEQTAQDVAEWTTGLNEQMGQLMEDMAKQVETLDLSKEAAENGRATVQGYIDAAGDMIPQVSAVYASVARAAQRALDSAVAYDPYAFVTGGYGLPVNKGFAGGTNDAPPGWAWVGEDGPELMRMRGGEQVLPSGASQRAAERYLEVSGTGPAAASAGKIEMHLHIEAGAPPETVDAWRDYADRGELKATILEVMEEADADRRRRCLT